MTKQTHYLQHTLRRITMNKLYNIFSYTHPHNSSEEKVLRELHNMWEIHLDYLKIDPVKENLGFIVERQNIFGAKPMANGTFSHSDPINHARPHLEGMSICRVNIAGFSQGEKLERLFETLFHEVQHFMQHKEGRLSESTSYWRNPTNERPKSWKVYKGIWEGESFPYTECQDLPWEKEAKKVAKEHLARIKKDKVVSKKILSFTMPKQTVRRRGEKRLIYNPFK